MAAKYNFGAINILHLIKDSNKKPRHCILGSVGPGPADLPPIENDYGAVRTTRL